MMIGGGTFQQIGPFGPGTQHHFPPSVVAVHAGGGGFGAVGSAELTLSVFSSAASALVGSAVAGDSSSNAAPSASTLHPASAVAVSRQPSSIMILVFIHHLPRPGRPTVARDDLRAGRRARVEQAPCRAARVGFSRAPGTSPACARGGSMRARIAASSCDARGDSR